MISKLFSISLQKSINFPFSSWILKQICITLSIKLAILIKSFSPHLRVVIADVPNLIPPGFKALVSPKIEFLLILIFTNSHTFSTLFPDNPLSLTLTKTI